MMTEINSILIDQNQSDPNKYEEKLLEDEYPEVFLLFLRRLQRHIAKAISAYFFIFLRINSMKNAEIIEIKIAPRSGLKPAQRPMAIPQREV